MLAHRASFLRITALAMSLATLSACQTGQGVGQNTVVGAGAGALIGGVGCALAGGNATQCALITAAGAVVGGTIGAQIDARDRERRQAALMEAIRDEEYQDQQAARSSIGGQNRAAPRAAPKQVAWNNPDTGNRGTITPLRGVVKNKECKVMKETYFKDGEPISDETKLCRQADGSWK
ncbi:MULTISPECIES: RT0821/Lpp0805 family surface protein [unclassified Aureimonas]|uniref:RT0821/Lpp0805 family surface protein n=1 Tax=unclassified Aureimonas TaxID=2615206 RepID=UPI0006FE04CB|nr:MULTISPECIES: RT0821/Lpp0805 family surface protein [unclassified Aureimonas]KQT69850.1 hypothetical protein ASG62_01720 [Aureimonas sp. Leaf427]KQT75998.1 hypothetical protein ASG54_14500 [Aureimonas sp. Leaf460]